MQDAPLTQHRQIDLMDPARARAVQVALGEVADIEAGSPLPTFFHQLYFWDPQPPHGLGRDGHPRVGQGLIPDLGLPRRMWAGGALEFHVPLRAGVAAEKRSTVVSTAKKDGRTGPLGFVTLRHDVHQGGQLCVSEWHDLVYREDPDPQAPRPVPPRARTDEDSAEVMRFDSSCCSAIRR